MLQVIEDPVHLIHVSLGIVVLHCQLVAVGFADGAGLISPAVPDVAPEVMDVVGLLLPDPQKLINTGLEVGAAQGQDGELLLQIIAVHKTELFHRVGGGTVLPMGTHRKVRVPNTAIQYIAAVGLENFVRAAHRRVLLFISVFPAPPGYAWRWRGRIRSRRIPRLPAGYPRSPCRPGPPRSLRGPPAGRALRRWCGPAQ